MIEIFIQYKPRTNLSRNKVLKKSNLKLMLHYLFSNSVRMLKLKKKSDDRQMETVLQIVTTCEVN